jgi:hypothetical protein
MRRLASSAAAVLAVISALPCQAQTPTWATCERLIDDLEGDSVEAIPLERLTTLSFAHGLDPTSVDPIPVRWGIGLWDGPSPIGLAEWSASAAGELVIGVVEISPQRVGLAVLNLPRGDAGHVGEQARTVEVTVRVVDAASRSVLGEQRVTLDNGTDDLTASFSGLRLGAVGEQLLVLTHHVYYCPGGAVEYCGFTSWHAVFALDDSGTLVAAGQLPHRITLNGSNILWGGVFRYDFEFVDLDGVGILEARLRPGSSNPSVAPVVVHVRWSDEAGQWTLVETDLSDLLLPAYNEAIQSISASRLSDAARAVSDFVEAALVVFTELPRDSNLRNLALQHLLFEREELSPRSEFRLDPRSASRARILTMLIGMHAIVNALDREGERHAGQLKSALRRLGSLELCDIYEEILAAEVRVSWTDD